MGNPSVKADPIDTKNLVWDKAEQVIKAGVDARKGKSVVLTVGAGKTKDGDTVDFGEAGKSAGITGGVCRVDGLDAHETAKSWQQPPDPGQAYGDRAKQELIRLIENNQVNVSVTKAVDATGKRSVCQIDIQGKNVTAEMVKAGAAYLTEKFWKDAPESVLQVGQREALRTFQREATKKGIGQFALPKNQQTLPYSHRKAQKQLQEEYVKSH